MSQFAKKVNNKKKYKKKTGQGLTKRQKQQVEQLISDPVEKKYYDTTYDANNVPLTPQWTDLTAPAPGTGMDQIIGTTMNLVSLQYRFTFVKADDTNYVRYLILQWFPDNGHDAPAWNQVFQYHTASLPVGLSDIMSPYQLGEGGTNNFKVLVDEQFYLDSDNPIQMVKGFINKGFRKELECSGASNNGTSHLFLMYVSDSSLSTHPLIYGHTRARFTDS